MATTHNGGKIDDDKKHGQYKNWDQKNTYKG